MIPISTLDHPLPARVQRADAPGVEVWAQVLEEIRHVSLQVVLVGELLPSHLKNGAQKTECNLIYQNRNTFF